MNSDIIIRNIKLSLLTRIEMKEPCLSIYTSLKDIFANLNIYSNKHQEFHSYLIFYGSSKENLYIEYDPKYEQIWLDRTNVWNYFENTYDMKFVDVQKLTSWYLNTYFKIKGTTNVDDNLRFKLK